MIGGTQFHTFDGQEYHGILTYCDLLLVTDGCENEAPNKLKITVKNFPCSRKSDPKYNTALSICKMHIKIEIDVSWKLWLTLTLTSILVVCS